MSFERILRQSEIMRRQDSVAEYNRFQAALLADILPESILDTFNPVAQAADDEKAAQAEAHRLEAQAKDLRSSARTKLASTIDEASASLIEHSNENDVDARTLLLGYVGLNNFAEQLSGRETINGTRIAPRYLDEESILGVFDGMKINEPVVSLSTESRSGIISSDVAIAITGTPAFTQSGNLNLSAKVSVPMRVIRGAEMAESPEEVLTPVRLLPASYIAGCEAVRQYFDNSKFKVGYSDYACGHGPRRTNLNRLELDLQLANTFTEQGVPMPTEQLLEAIEKGKLDEVQQGLIRISRRRLRGDRRRFI